MSKIEMMPEELRATHAPATAKLSAVRPDEFTFVADHLYWAAYLGEFLDAWRLESDLE